MDGTIGRNRDRDSTAHPCAGNSRWFEELFGKRLARLAASLPVGTVAAARERGRRRDLFTTGQEYLEKLKASPGLPTGPKSDQRIMK